MTALTDEGATELELRLPLYALNPQITFSIVATTLTDAAAVPWSF